MKNILLVANVAKEHIIKFHIPTIKMLKEEGWTVDVACSGEEKVPFCHVQYSLPCERASLNLNTFKGIQKLRTIIESRHYDIIYCHTTVGGFIGRLASIRARKNRTKVIYLSHGYFFYRGAPLINWIKFYPVEKILSFFTDSIITVNKEDYRLAKKKFKHCKIFRINGIGVDYNRLKVDDPAQIRKLYRQNLKIPKDAIVLIYLAELHENKNQIFLIKVLKDLIDKGENVYLVLPGIDHCNGAYENYSRRLGIENRVLFLGWRDDVGNLYAMADICTASSIREGFGLNLAEALAAGIPVVATCNRGHSTIIEDGKNGFLVKQNDVTGFAEKIQLLIHNDELKEKFIQYGLRDRAKYSSNEVLDRLKEILETHLGV